MITPDELDRLLDLSQAWAEASYHRGIAVLDLAKAEADRKVVRDADEAAGKAFRSALRELTDWSTAGADA